MIKEEVISILKRKSTIPDDDYCWDEIEEAFNIAIESIEKIEKIERILCQVGHLQIRTMFPRQLKTLIHYHLRMITPMAAVKRIVLRQYGLLYVLIQCHSL